MPNLSAVPPELLTFLNNSLAIRIQEIVAVAWVRGTQIKYYGNTDVVAIMPGATLTANGITTVEPRFKANQFIDMPGSGGWGDDEITLDFDDTDRAITQLWQQSGEGTQVKVLYWIPDAYAGGYLGEYFWGFMKQPKDIHRGSLRIPVAEGFRSPHVKVPRRIIFPGCQAHFGGLIDPATGVPYFNTQEKIDNNDCPYNIHIGGTFGRTDPANPTPPHAFTSCPRTNRSECIKRIGDDYSYLAFDVVLKQSPYGGKHRNRFVSITQANDNVLKDPLRVVAGTRFVNPLTCLWFYNQVDPKNGGGHVYSNWAICEGPVADVYGFTLNGQFPGNNNYRIEFGEKRQNPNEAGTLNYSGTAVIKMVRDVGFTALNADQLNGATYVKGKKIRVYNNPPTSYNTVWSNSRAWWLLEILANRRWGLGIPYEHFHLDDWIWLDAWSNESTYTVDESGAQVNMTRTQFDAIMEGEDARELVRNVCQAGRYTPPFNHNGKLRVMPIQGESVATTPLFYDSDDYGSSPNILWDRDKSSLIVSQKSQAELVNRIKLTFDNGDQRYNYVEHPVIYEDVHAQLAAGKALGDTTTRVIEKSYSAFGTTRFGEAVRCARLLLDLGEFDTGGLKNNLSVKFKTWWPLGDAFGLHKYRIIKVKSLLLQGFVEPEQISNPPFEYFRIMKMRRLPGLQLEIEAQAYPYAYYVQRENAPADRPVNARHFPNWGGTNLLGRRFAGTVVLPEVVAQYNDHVTVRVVTDDNSPVTSPPPADGLPLGRPPVEGGQPT